MPKACHTIIRLTTYFYRLLSGIGISVRFASSLPENIEIKTQPENEPKTESIHHKTWLDQLWSPIAAWMGKTNQPIL